MAGEQGFGRSGRVDAVDLPGNYLGDEVPLFVGIQRRDEVEQVVAATDSDACFLFEVRLLDQDGGIDLRGPFVHGRKGDRFLYLCWGHSRDVEPFVRYARSKLMFSDVPAEMLRRLKEDEQYELVALFSATNHKGTEASGTVRPPQVSWGLELATG